MAILDKIEVRIRSNGEILTEYHDPDQAAPQDTKATTKFIEATPGAKFSIEVSINEGYKFYGADCVLIRRRMDGQCCSRARFIHKTASGDSVARSIAVTIEHDKRFDNRSGQWTEAFLAFGQLEILEHSELPDDFDAQKAMQLGTIELTCHRVHRKLREVPVARIYPALNSVNQASEKMLKGKAIENNIRYVDERVIPGPPPDRHDFVALNGSYGHAFVFKFHYRSHRALQTLGCIPRSESPAIVIQDNEEAETKPVLATSGPNNTVVDRSQRAKERERLQAELARLDRLDRADRGVKVEGAQNEDLYDVSREPSAMPNLKREHEANGVLIKHERSASGARKRAKTSGPVETVDLTED